MWERERKKRKRYHRESERGRRKEGDREGETFSHPVIESTHSNTPVFPGFEIPAAMETTMFSRVRKPAVFLSKHRLRLGIKLVFMLPFLFCCSLMFNKEACREKYVHFFMFMRWENSIEVSVVCNAVGFCILLTYTHAHGDTRTRLCVCVQRMYAYVYFVACVYLDIVKK